MLGGTVEADMDNRGLDTPMFSMDSKTNESSCPSWLRKVNLTFTFTIIKKTKQALIFLFTSFLLYDRRSC